MARIRTIKPEFWTSEQIVECSPNARLLFIGMWNFADDGGVIPDSWKRLKMQVFPGDAFTKDQVEKLIFELVSNGLVLRFMHENQAYLLIKGWYHQKIDRPSYKFPQPDEATKFDDDSSNARRTLDGRHPPEGKGEDRSVREGSGKEIMSARSGRFSNSDYSEEFNQFWNAFPKVRRTKKQEAYRKWKLAVKRVDAETLTSKAAEYAESDKGRSEYAVMPSVWLNGGMWEDDPESWSNGNRSRSVSQKPKERIWNQ